MLTLITTKMKVIKRIKSRGKMFLNPGVKSVKALIKSKCKVRLAKQRSIIKNKKLNLLIKPCTTSRKSGPNDPKGSAINGREGNDISLYSCKTPFSF